MHSRFRQRIWAALLICLLALSACSYRTPSVSPSSAEKTAQVKATADYAQAVEDTLARSTQDYLSQDPELLGYRSVLLLERAADLILYYESQEQAQAAQTQDTSGKEPYMDAFPVAVDVFNQTLPPEYMNHAWQQVAKVVGEYRQAYEGLQKDGKLSVADLAKLKVARQLLSNYQSAAEANLKRRGLGLEFLTYQHLWAEQYLQAKYGSLSVPTLAP